MESTNRGKWPTVYRNSILASGPIPDQWYVNDMIKLVCGQVHDKRVRNHSHFKKWS